jgi:DNA ligase-1
MRVLMPASEKVLLAQPFRKRRALLRAGFPPLVPEGTRGAAVARFDHVKSVESSEGREAVEAFWQESVESRSEGLMIKVSAMRSDAFVHGKPYDGWRSS